jgi:GTP cyclohydrolase II
MSNLKSAALLAAGITMDSQVEIPADRISANAQVEITAKIASGYFSEQR